MGREGEAMRRGRGSRVGGSVVRGGGLVVRSLTSRALVLALPAAVALLVAPAPAAAEGACPNEALRWELRSGALPDCRAYELVSPVYKEGTNIATTYAVSPNGLHFIAGSLGIFAGAEQGEFLGGAVQAVVYEFSRVEGSGWQVSSLAPPASLYISKGMVDASPYFSNSLWELRTLSQPEGVSDLYIEQPRGTFTEVGPPAPETVHPGIFSYYAPLGASADLSHVLFSVEPGFRWPSDTTVNAGNTLYEYVGVNQSEPSLVGVSGGRGSRELVSQCGTRLGSSGAEEHLIREQGNVAGSMYNAISPSGARIFFTAVGEDEVRAGEEPCGGKAPPVGELLAREELPSGEMGTVPISEPSLSYCSAAPSPPCADATFQGASEDGSKVFFTTEQELLPGARGENLYEYDFEAPAGERVRLLSAPLAGEAEVQGVARISEDGSHVYFVAKGVLTQAPNGVGSRAEPAAENLYVSAAGRTSFVATLSAADAGDWSRADYRPVKASQDGRYLVFTSVADLTDEGLVGGRPQVFQYDAETGGLVRASIGQDGYGDDDRAPVEGSTFPVGSSYVTDDSPAVAAGGLAPEDGAVFFESPDALTPQALSDQPDSLGTLLLPNVYEYRDGNVYLLSDGRDTSVLNGGPGSSLIGSDPSGEDVFFFTSDSLIPEDGDTQQDIYDARVNGGFPTPSAPLGCIEEACRGPLSATPAQPLLGGSATQAEEAGVQAPPSATPKPKPKPKVRAKKRPKAKKRKRAKARRLAARRGLLHDGRTL